MAKTKGACISSFLILEAKSKLTKSDTVLSVHQVKKKNKHPKKKKTDPRPTLSDDQFLFINLSVDRSSPPEVF